jgi:hypothetical protein
MAWEPLPRPRRGPERGAVPGRPSPGTGSCRRPSRARPQRRPVCRTRRRRKPAWSASGSQAPAPGLPSRSEAGVGRPSWMMALPEPWTWVGALHAPPPALTSDTRDRSWRCPLPAPPPSPPGGSGARSGHNRVSPRSRRTTPAIWTTSTERRASADPRVPCPARPMIEARRGPPHPRWYPEPRSVQVCF